MCTHCSSVYVDLLSSRKAQLVLVFKIWKMGAKTALNIQ